MSAPGEWRGACLPGIGAATVVLVTGGTGAIGRAVATAFRELGASVAVVARSAPGVEEATGSWAGGGLGLAADIAAPDEAARVVGAVVQRWGHLDVVVQSAAIGDGLAPLEGIRADVIDRVLATNVKGIILVAQAAAAVMRPRGTGVIINVASIAGHRTMLGHTVYGAAKAGVLHATRVLATELGPDGIRVNSVSPGQTPTVLTDVDDAPGTGAGRPSPGGDVSRIPSRRRGVLDDYVGPVLFLASDLANYVNGVDLLVDGGAAIVR